MSRSKTRKTTAAKRGPLVFALSTALLGLGLWPCQATLTVRLSADNGVTWTAVADGDPQDQNPVTGAVTFSGPVGNWTVNVTTGLSKPASGTAQVPQVDLSSLDISGAAGTLLIQLSETDFAAIAGTEQYALGIGGTTDGQVSFQAWLDPGNTLFATTEVLGSQGPFSGGPFHGGITDTIGPVAGPYSLTFQVKLSHTGTATLISSFDASLTTPLAFIKCPGDMNLGCNPPTIPDCDLTQVAVTDTCSTPPVITCSSSDSVSGCVHTRTITYLATDACGDHATCIQHLTWKVDMTAPALIGVPGNITLPCGTPVPPPPIVTALDDCDGDLTSQISFSQSTQGSGCSEVITRTWTVADGCGNRTTATQLITMSGCTITGVTISNVSWNKFSIPTGTSPVVWVHAHIGKPSGIPTNGVSTLEFVGVTLTLNATVYTLPDGVMTFDSSAPATITTSFTGGRWETVINPNHMSDEMFFTGAAIPVTASVAAGAKATLSFTALSSATGVSFPWQWSGAVFTYWPADWNQAMVQPYHSSYHAGTPLNVTVQKSLIQGPRGGGGSNFTGSWSATGTAVCP